MAQVVDTKGNVRANPKTGRINGKSVRKANGNGFPNAVTNAYNNIVQTASIPSTPSMGMVGSNKSLSYDIPVQTASMSGSQLQHVTSRPSSIDVGSMLKKGIKNVIENDVSWDDGSGLMLSGGALPGSEVENGISSDDLPDLNPFIESMREHLSNAMTKPSDDQISYGQMASGISPSVDRSAMESRGPIDMPDINASIDNIRDALGNIITKPKQGSDMIPIGTISGGAVPLVDNNDIKPGEPKDIKMPQMPSFDGIRDYLNGIMTKQPDEKNSTSFAALANGAIPSVSNDAIRNTTGNIFEDKMFNLIGDTDSNQAYIRDAIENGNLSEDDANDIMSRGSWLEQLNKAFSQPLIGSGDVIDNRETLGDITAIDDGTKYDYDHMTADTMTGTQYMHYAEIGMGGRPVEQIDPTKTYSKRREHINYGFTPFVPDQTAYANMIADNVMDVPHRLGTMLGGLRENIPGGYKINYDGGKIDGNDFDRLATAYLNQFYYNDRFHPEKYLTEPSGDTTALVREYAIPDVNGDIEYAYGDIIDSGYDDTLYLTFSDGETVDISPEEYEKWSVSDDGIIVPDKYFQAHGNITDSGYDDTFYLTFSDGQKIGVSADYIESASDNNGNIDFQTQRIPADEAHGNLPDDLDVLNDMSKIDENVNEYGGSPLDYAGVIYMPNLVLSDGTSIPYSDVERIYWDETPDDDASHEDDDISYEFKRFGIGPLSFDNRPRRLNQQEMFKSNDHGGLDVDLSDIGNNAIDWTLGSLPISIGSTMPWVYSASGATSSLAGVDPGSYDPTTDSYGLIAGDYDDQGRLRYGVTNEKGEMDDELSDSTRWWNAAGNAAVPLTENIAGGVGSDPARKLVDAVTGNRFVLPSNPTTMQVIVNALLDAAGEGLEEDIGNVFDDITQYGPSGAFANTMVDEYGRPMRDMYGHEVRDYDTRLEDRANTFMDPGDLANSFAGGVTVDALMQAIPIASQLIPSVRRDIARRKTGVRQFVDPGEREKRLIDNSLEFDDDIER